MHTSADVVVCGAGIAGVAAAYNLAVKHGFKRVVLVDEREPLTLTSDKGTQGYRNWWPGPDDAMFKLVSRSIDLLEETALESGNIFRMNRRGYVFATADEARVAEYESTAAQVSSFGMGPVRVHRAPGEYQAPRAEGFLDQPRGADILSGDALRSAFPYLASDAVAALHVRRAGTMNAVVLGGWWMKRAQAHGAAFVRDKVVGIDAPGGRVSAVRLASGGTIETTRVVVAAGPAVHEVGRMFGLELPVFHELHFKVTFRDTDQVVPRNAPFLIWSDPMTLAWNADERARLGQSDEGRRVMDQLPGGVHLRPVDLSHGDELYLIWTYETEFKPYLWPPTFSEHAAAVVLRGVAQMVPGMARYIARGAVGIVDGGYYCKTRENRPLIGPLPIEGAYVVAALSGSGLMGAAACAELAALHVAEQPLPDYARAFSPSRYDDPDYLAMIEQWDSLVGQL
jgi:glycine/D-amino acid oxidase-like deaminating enzyme